MKHNHSPRHHLLRSRYRIRTCMSLRKVHSDKMRHTHSHQKHEEKWNPGRHLSFHRCVMFLMFHNHTQNKCRQQDFNMNTSLVPIQFFTPQIQYLSSQKYNHWIKEDSLPILTPIILIQSLPADRQKQEHNHHHNNQLPAQPDHHNLKRNH